METTLQTKKINCYQKVYTSVITAEETGETVVPDKMPDIGMIAHTGASVLLRSKEATEGNVTMQGEILVTVLYLPDGAAGLRALNIALPCTASFDSADISQNCVPEGMMRVCTAEARLLNPRKILVKVEVSTEVACYERAEAVYCDGISEPGSEKVQLRHSTAKFGMVAAACERTFVVTDEYVLDADVSGEVVGKKAQFRIEDIKTIANKLIVKGTVASEVLYMTADGEIETARFNTVFSQIVETDSEEISTDARVMIMPTGLYYELATTGNDPRITMELHGVCQVAVMSQHEISFVSDAFSNRCACEVSCEPLCVTTQSRTTIQRETVRENIPCKSQVAKVHYVTCEAGKATVTGNEVCIRIDVTACVAYENGANDCIGKRMEVTFTGDSGVPLMVDGVRCLDLYAVPSGNSVELRFTVEADLRTEVACELHTVAAIRLDEEQPICSDRPSLTVVRTGGTIWDIARKYGSTVELIRKINELEEEDVPAGSVLFVPRERF